MHRYRASLLLVAFSLVVLIPHSALAATTNFFGPILDKGIQNCPAGWGGLLTTINNLVTFAISFGIIIAVLMAAYAGFLWVLNPTNPENRATGRKLLINAVVGLIITLAAWLIINTLLIVLGAGGIASKTSILTGGSANGGSGPCVTAVTPVTPPPGAPSTAAPSGVAPPISGTGPCDPSILKSAAQAGGYTLTDAQAKTFACIAQPESSCNNNPPQAKQPNGTPTTASGAFQIVLGINDTCHNLNLPACGNLNCSSAFSGGTAKTDADSQRLAAQCRAAASNLNCNLAAATCLLQREPNKNFSDWTADPRSSAQAACVNTYNH